MAQKHLDKTPRIMIGKADVEQIKKARRWLRGVATILADASNGDELVDRIAAEASVLANMAEIAVFGLEERDEDFRTGANRKEAQELCSGQIREVEDLS